MSEIDKRPITKVMPIAVAVSEALQPYCERIAIAGSLRRQSHMIGDIEILAIPKKQLNLFGEVDSKLPTGLDNYLNGLIGDRISHLPKPRWGPKMKSFALTSSMGCQYQVDLFIQFAETWGVNMMIRTGSAAFAKKMVTQKSKGGFLPDNMHVGLARLWRDGELLDTPEERDVFAEMGMDWIKPSERG